jgi:hypothetical protein
MAKDNRTKRTTRGRFPKGTSGNPAGRPVGSRNKKTLFLEELLDREGEAIIRKTMELALQGNPLALRLCLDRLVAPRKERPIHLELPKVTKLQHAVVAMSKIQEAIGEGKITPGEGQILAGFAETQQRVIGVANKAQERGTSDSLMTWEEFVHLYRTRHPEIGNDRSDLVNLPSVPSTP